MQILFSCQQTWTFISCLFSNFLLNFVGLLFIATRICCSSFLSICLGDSTLSANTVIFRVSSWTSEKMGIKKEKADVIGHNHYNNDTHIAITNDKDKRYVKKMLEANSQLQPGIKLFSIKNNFILLTILKWWSFWCYISIFVSV